MVQSAERAPILAKATVEAEPGDAVIDRHRADACTDGVLLQALAVTANTRQCSRCDAYVEGDRRVAGRINECECRPCVALVRRRENGDRRVVIVA